MALVNPTTVEYLKIYDVHIELKNNMHQNLLTQITQTLKNTDTLLAKNWYSMMKLDLAKIKIVNVYKLAKNVFIKYPWE